MPCCPNFLYPTWQRINVIAVYCDKMNKFSIFGFKKMVFGRFFPKCFDFTRGMFLTTMSWEKEVVNKQMWNAPVEKICCLCKQWLKIHCLPSRGTWNLLPFLTKNCSVAKCNYKLLSFLQSLPAMIAGKHYTREAMVKWKCIPLRPENRKSDFLHSWLLKMTARAVLRGVIEIAVCIGGNKR